MDGQTSVMTVNQISQALDAGDQHLGEIERRLTAARDRHFEMLSRYGNDQGATAAAVQAEQDQALEAAEGEVAAAADAVGRQARRALTQLERAASLPTLSAEEQARADILHEEIKEDVERLDAGRLRDRVVMALMTGDRAAMRLYQRYLGQREWTPKTGTPDEAGAIRELPHLLAQIDAQLRDPSFDPHIARSQRVLDRALAVSATASRRRIAREAQEAAHAFLPADAVRIPADQ